MKVKSKAVYIAIIAVLALSLIGMAVGLVLVARNVATNNSMTIRYEVTGASCDITAYGINYENAGNVDKSDIYVRESEDETPTQTSITKEIKFGNTAGGSFIFSSADKSATPLTATGRAAYFFQIENTANATSERMLQAKAVITNPTEANNIKIHLGLSESAVEETSATYNIGTGGETATIVVILEVDDDTVGANYNCEFDLEIGYELGDITNMEDANSATTAASADDIKNEVESYSTLAATRYYDANGNAVSSASEATVKVESYPTVDIYYGDVATSNAISANSNSISAIPSKPTGHKVTNKRYIHLIDNIDMTDVQSMISGEKASIILDGGKYDNEGNLIEGEESIIHISASNLDNDGYLFNSVYDSIFKNLKLCIHGDLAGLTCYTRGEYVTFENVTIISDSYINVNSSDNNESPFMVFNYADKLNFIDCHNTANYLSKASYYGLFVGGYCVSGAGEVTFDNCSNSGDIHTFGSVGILFGNGAYRPTGGDNGYTIKNFVNSGTIYYTPQYATDGTTITNTPHILTPSTSGAAHDYSFQEDEKLEYDQNIEGVIDTNDNFVQIIESNFTAKTNYTDLVIESKDSNNLQVGNYDIIFSSYFYHKNYNNGTISTMLVSIPVELEISGTTNSQTLSDILLPIIDKGAYEAQGYSIDSNATWTPIMDGNYKYTKTNIAYVVDTNGQYVLHKQRNSRASTVITAISNSGEIIGYANNCINYAIQLYIANSSNDSIDLEFFGDNSGLGTIHGDVNVAKSTYNTANVYYYYDDTTDPADAELSFNIILPNTGTRYRINTTYTDSTGTVQNVTKYFETSTDSTTTITAEELGIPLSTANDSAPQNRYFRIVMYNA